MRNFIIDKITYSKPQPIATYDQKQDFIVSLIRIFKISIRKYKTEKEIKPNILAHFDKEKTRLALYLISCFECVKYVPNLASAPSSPKQESKTSF